MYTKALTDLNIPGQNNKGNIRSSQCTDPYSFYSTNNKICKKGCNEGEYIDINNNECLSSCSHDFIGENNECFSVCNSPTYTYAYADTSMKKLCIQIC